MHMRIHRHDSEVILAACDDDVFGKTFTGDGTRITVNEGFYGMKVVEPSEVAEAMGSATIMNLVGEEVIALATIRGYVSEGTVIDIGGVKHVQVVMM